MRTRTGGGVLVVVLTVIACVAVVPCGAWGPCAPCMTTPGINVWITARFITNLSVTRQCVPVVCGGVPTTGFADTLTGMRQVILMDPYAPLAQFAWNWVPPVSTCNDTICDSCTYTTDYIQRLGVSGATYTPAAATGTTVSVTGLSSFGSPPPRGTLSYFNATVGCAAASVITLSFTLDVWCKNVGNAVSVLDSTSFSLSWACAKPGCPAYCHPDHGYCDPYHGVCICTPPWTGATCEFMFSYTPTVCPGQYITMSYYVPASMYGLPQALTVMAARLFHSIMMVETRYFLHWKDTVNASDPDLAYPVNGTGYFPGFYTPGAYPIMVYAALASPITYLTAVVIVKDWSLCGVNATCGDGTSNDCGATNQWGQCYSGKCVCNEARFWSDCSRGCSGYTVVEDGSGVVKSDYPPDGSVASMCYLRKNICRWLISPTGKYDIIKMNFTSFGIMDPDKLLVFSSDENGETDELLATYGSTFTEDYLEVEAHHVFLEWSSGPYNTYQGFVLEYSTKNKPIPDAGLALIFFAAAVVGLGVAICLAVGARIIVVKRRKRLQAARNMPALNLKDMMTEEEMASLCGVEKNQEILEEVRVQLDKYELTFGVTGLCPVQKPMFDKITIFNKNGSTLHYQFSVLNLSYLVATSIRPGVGKIPPHKRMEVDVECSLLMTTRFQHPIRLDIVKPTGELDNEGKEIVEILATAYISVTLEGELSRWIDPADFTDISAPIARGGFGCVYRGKYRGVDAALKMLLHQETFNKTENEGFEKECSLMNKLNHPCVVTFIGASHVPGRFCICCEWIPFGSLSSLLKAEGVFDIPIHREYFLIKCALNTAEALAYLHTMNILYRDLKCSNVLVCSLSLDADVNCKLTDFDTARNVDNPNLVMMYTTKLGTGIFMAPELLAPCTGYNNKVDTYSYSLCLWEMWTRQEPWADVTPEWAVRKMVKSGQRPPLDKMDPPAPPSILDLIQKCWHQDLHARPAFPDIVEILEDIKATYKDRLNVEESDSKSEGHHKKHHRHHHHKGKKGKKSQSRSRSRSRSASASPASASASASESESKSKSKSGTGAHKKHSSKKHKKHEKKSAKSKSSHSDSHKKAKGKKHNKGHSSKSHKHGSSSPSPSHSSHSRGSSSS
ncbi:ATP binding protein [Pelomyxa schiedti]|nr:ATP binding protein [Pelomyxa schiedti]